MHEATISRLRAIGLLGGVALAALALIPVVAQAQSACPLVPLAIRSSPGPDFAVGCTEYVLKYGGGSGTLGSFGTLDFSGFGCPDDSCGTGGNGYRCRLLYGYPCCVDTGTCVLNEAGNMSGPTASGIQTRFLADTDQRDRICRSEYYGNGQRIIVAPITGPPEGSGSSACYRVHRLGMFFLTHVPGTGESALVFVNFLGYVSEWPTAVRASTWGAIKQLYR